MLNDIEKDVIQILLNNELLLKVIHKVFDNVIEAHRPIVTDSDNNAILGEKYRAFEQSKMILEMGFNQLETYKSGQKEKSKLNRGR